jgi:hypothetical protein
MEKERFKALMEKYISGCSTLEEEELLMKHENGKNEYQSSWFSYIKKKRKSPPPQLNDTIWKAIQKKEKQRPLYKLAIAGISLAASIALLLIFYQPEPISEDASLAEKEAQLKEALSMFEDEKNESPKKMVLYEDDMIIIYTTSE